jgi:hypothetical protein
MQLTFRPTQGLSDVQRITPDAKNHHFYPGQGSAKSSRYSGSRGAQQLHNMRASVQHCSPPKP